MRAESKLTRREWDRHALLARAGSEASYEILCAAALPVAESVIRRHRYWPRIDAGEFGGDVLWVFSKKSDALISDLRSVLNKWDPEKGGGFLTFLRRSIIWNVKNAARRAANVPIALSLNELVGGNGAVVADFIGDDGAGDGDFFDYDAARAKLDEMMKGLTDRQRIIITRRHLLNGATTVPTLEELGDEMGLSRETIRKDEIAAAQKLGLKG